MKSINNDRITYDELVHRVSYDPETGQFTWRIRAARRVRIGDRAGSKHSVSGYWIICFDDRRYMGHRLAWLYFHKAWPEGEIDHINGDKTDNRIANLREATHSQNKAHSPLQRNNRSGFKGVHKFRNRWIASIRTDRKLTHLGSFATPEEASEAYAKAAKARFGEFANP